MIREAPARPPGMASLFTAALGQSADLVQTEFRLARAELSEKLAAVRNGLVMIIISAILLIVALGMMLQALVGVLIDAGMSPPLAIALVAGGTAVLGMALFLIGQRRLKPTALTPDRTLGSLSADGRMIKDTVT